MYSSYQRVFFTDSRYHNSNPHLMILVDVTSNQNIQIPGDFPCAFVDKTTKSKKKEKIL